jgi:hypothetical protein
MIEYPPPSLPIREAPNRPMLTGKLRAALNLPSTYKDSMPIEHRVAQHKVLVLAHLGGAEAFSSRSELISYKSSLCIVGPLKRSLYIILHMVFLANQQQEQNAQDPRHVREVASVVSSVFTCHFESCRHSASFCLTVSL